MKIRHLLLLAAAAAALACKRGDSKSGAVVAHVGNDTITADEFKKRLDETSPFLRARYTTIERKKEFLENMIRNELLAQEAERQGLDKSPQVREQMKRAMIQELIKKQLDEKLTGADIPESELKAFYDSHIDDFVKPERARVYHITLAAKTPKEKAEAKKKAQALLKEIAERTKKGDQNAFQAIAMKESKDPLSAPMGGDLRFLSKDELAKAYSPELANAAFALKNPGDVSDPIETPTGVDIVKLQVKTVALNRTFDESKESIRGRMARERRSKEYDDFVKKLRENGNVSIDEAELAKVNPTELPPQGPLAMPPRPAGAVPLSRTPINDRTVPVSMPPSSNAPAPAAAKIGGN